MLFETPNCSQMSTNPPTDPTCKTPWPPTYLGRLEAVIAQLRKMRGPARVEAVLEYFSGVTAEQVEATLGALVLFGRVEKKGKLFAIPNQSSSP